MLAALFALIPFERRSTLHAQEAAHEHNLFTAL
jgi:hypothetical protein